MNGNPNHPSAAVMAKNGENLSDALHLIRARQDAYQAEHSNYARHMIYSENLGTDDELIVHVRNSHYGVQVFCSGLNASRTAVLQYAVTAMPNPRVTLRLHLRTVWTRTKQSAAFSFPKNGNTIHPFRLVA